MRQGAGADRRAAAMLPPTKKEQWYCAIAGGPCLCTDPCFHAARLPLLLHVPSILDDKYRIRNMRYPTCD